MHTLFLCVSVVIVAMATAQSSKLKWLPKDMFNPIDQAAKCGRQSREEGYVCDPNGILGDDLESFNWILKDAAMEGTKCPCSNYYCENHRGGVGTGYKISLAIVRGMTLERGLDGRQNTAADQAKLFAYHLENKHWDMGQCEEDIVIFYSVDDKMLSIATGKTASRKLTPFYSNLLAYRVQSRLDDGRYVEAFNNLIYDMKVVLNCDEQISGYNCGLHEMRNSAPGLIVSMTTAFLSVTVSVLFSLHLL